MISPSLDALNRRKLAVQLSARVVEAMDQPRPDMLTDVVIDLEQVTWISSVGLNELIQLQTRARGSGISMRLRSLNQAVRDVFRITRLERMFEFEEEAARNDDSLKPNSLASAVSG
ncbi:STAS domain-containing protein [Stieleria sp. TO1_6]|nr:STAS domain-containing protein [Stieleria tagensis]